MLKDLACNDVNIATPLLQSSKIIAFLLAGIFRQYNIMDFVKLFFVHSIKINAVLIQHHEIDSQGTFYIEEDQVQLAEMDYSISVPDTMIILHTEVDEVLKGKKIGSKLLEHAVEFARVKKYKIIPLCPFVKSVFDKNPESYQDVVKK